MFISDEFPMIMEREAGLPPHYPPMAVGFGISPLIDQMKTASAGHDVYSDVLFVKIATPGDRNSLYFQPATDTHKKRFPAAWQEYQKQEGRAGQSGLPVEQWAMISRSTSLNLRVAHIHTVEALSELGDEHLGSVANGRELREKAKLFIRQRSDGAAVAKAATDKQKLQDQITALQNQLAAMAAGNTAANQPAMVAAPDATKIDQAHLAAVEADVIKAARRPRAGRS